MTLSISERLQEIESQLPNAQERANCEAASLAARGDAGRFEGAARILDDLQCEVKDLRLQLRDMELRQAEDAQAALEAEIPRCQLAKDKASAAIEEARSHPVIVRWLKSDGVVNRFGVGYAWQIIKPWVASLKARTLAPPQVGAMAFSDWPNELRFTDPEREVVARFLKAKDAEQRAALVLADAHERHRQLLDAHPELKASA